MSISKEAIELLKRSDVTGNAIALPPGQLERILYEEVNEVLVRLGGKWKGRGKHPDGSPKGEHVFPYEAESLVRAVIETGHMPPKNPTAFFPTPRLVVEQMLESLDTWKYNLSSVRVLEPSAGQGGILDMARAKFPRAQFDAIEFLDLNAQVLRDKGYHVLEQDFMDFEPEYLYDLVLMNPPFSLDNDKKAWITHTQRAFDLLKPEGELVAIVPNSIRFVSDTQTEKFRSMVELYGGYDDLPAGAFKESGTGVQTCVLWMEKKDVAYLENQPCEGYISWYSYNFFLFVDNTKATADMLENLFGKMHQSGIDAKLIANFIEEVKKEYRRQNHLIPLTEKGQQQVAQEVIRLYEDWLCENGLERVEEEAPAAPPAQKHGKKAKPQFIQTSLFA